MEVGVRAGAVGMGASLVLHVALAWMLGEIEVGSPQSRSPVGTVRVELEVSDEVEAPSEAPPERDAHLARPQADEPLESGGPRTRENVSTDDGATGGERLGAVQVVMLAAHADDVTLQDSPMNAVTSAQTQRIATADTRATREDRRSTPNASDAAFLARGTGTHPERRPDAPFDPESGARRAPHASALGEGALSRAQTTERGATDGSAREPVDGSSPWAEPRNGDGGDAATSQDPAREGSAVASPGQGIQRGTGTQESERARVATGLPAIDRGPAATSATERDARVRDDTDAELRAIRMMQSMIEASRARAPEQGAGRGGGADALGDPGEGSSPLGHAGGRAAPVSSGNGLFASLDTRDSRYMRWFLDQRARIGRELVFPRPRMLAMDQGTSVYRVTVRRDGTFAAAPHLLRTSGFGDFDRAARLAIERSAPFAPLPRELAPELDEIRITLPVEFANPMAP